MATNTNIASPAAGTGTELIRSGYALRVGKIDALVVSDGTMSIPASVLAVNATPADLGAWLDASGQ